MAFRADAEINCQSLRRRFEFHREQTTISSNIKHSFHSKTIACVGKQPIMVATAANEHSYWLAIAFVASRMIGCLSTQALAFLAVFVYATQAIAFEWKPGLTLTI